tara:strand:+ start:146 stop:760 length:615 start_codon:yes stop_codon:yes gene_type:complete
MTEQDEARFIQAMNILEAVPAWGAVSPESYSTYFKVLMDLPIASVLDGVAYLMSTRTLTGSFPVPAEIKTAADSYAALKDDRPTADEDWIAAQAQIRADAGTSRARRMAFRNPVTNQAMTAIGGWMSVWEGGKEKESIFYAQFLKAHKSTTDQTLRRRLTGHAVKLEDGSRDESRQSLAALYKQIEDHKTHPTPLTSERKDPSQ